MNIVLTQAAAHLADALNDPDRSIIGDPRQGTYSVSVTTADMAEAAEAAKHLAALDMSEVRTNVRHDETGEPTLAYVTLYKVADQELLLRATESQLDPERRQRLEELVRARGPIFDETLRTIRNKYEAGWSAQRIANRMNEVGILDGMGGFRWTTKKVRSALSEADRRFGEEAAA